MARSTDPREELDELDRLLSDPDLLGDEEEIELITNDGVSTPRADREAVRALVVASPSLAANVRGARVACRSARESLARARDGVDRCAVDDPRTLALLAWLACMDELLQFAEQVGEVLGA